jgi:cytochrome P450/NADPH-cytochrome P450 reductase
MLSGGFEKLPSNAWKPFGNGQRSCIGRAFAIQESLLAVALILKHFNIEFVDPSYDLRVKQTLTIKPEGFKIQVRPRRRAKIPLGINNKQSEKTSAHAQPVETNNLRPMSVLFGSNSGSCESFAGILVSEAPTNGFNATIATLDSVVGSLPCDRPVIIVNFLVRR